MSKDCEDFWSNVPERAVQPTRVKVLEALWRIEKPLSAVQLVDVLDGEVSMWEVARHLRSLAALGVVEPVKRRNTEERPRGDGFDLPYELGEQEEGDDG